MCDSAYPANNLGLTEWKLTRLPVAVTAALEEI